MKVRRRECHRRCHRPHRGRRSLRRGPGVRRRRTHCGRRCLARRRRPRAARRRAGRARVEPPGKPDEPFAGVLAAAQRHRPQPGARRRRSLGRPRRRARPPRRAGRDPTCCSPCAAATAPGRRCPPRSPRRSGPWCGCAAAGCASTPTCWPGCSAAAAAASPGWKRSPWRSPALCTSTARPTSSTRTLRSPRSQPASPRPAPPR